MWNSLKTGLSQAKTHELFQKQYGGKVFYVISTKKDGKKVIYNVEVINEIKLEISRLTQTS